MRCKKVKTLADIAPCSYEGCDRPHYAKGYCASHYLQQWSGKPLRPLQGRKRIRPETCTYPGCDLPHRANGVCNAHYVQLSRQGRLSPRGWLEPNQVDRFEDRAEIVLVDKEGAECGRAIIDPGDVPAIESMRWNLIACGYAVSKARDERGREQTIYLHKFLVGGASDQVDHRDGDRLNNRRSNLVIVTPAQNAQNVARPGRELDRNVFLDRKNKTKPWFVRVRVNHVNYRGGSFATKEEAREAARSLRARVLTHHNEDRHS